MGTERMTVEQLIAALRPLAAIPVEEFGKENKPDYPLMGWNNHTLYVRDVLAARKCLQSTSGEKHG